MNTDATRFRRNRARFIEEYGLTTIETDYGSQQNFADAHRMYLEKVRRRDAARAQPQEHSGVIQWVEVVRTSIVSEGGPPEIIPYPRPQQQLPPELDTLQFELVFFVILMSLKPPVFYRAASFMRRFLAEVLDFLFVMMFKLFVLAMLVEVDLVDLSSWGGTLDDEQDVMQVINLAQELLPVEIACKFICCILEAVFMSYRIGVIGIGQTPGKFMLGIRVISCHDVLAADIPGHIIVQGPNLISLQQSLKRSFMKNVVVNSLFPLSTAAFQVHNGRVFYDVVVRTVVVMEL
ncbi:hypothetical protein CRE_00937 [Caenorhabditis remanei]|uniref:Uncharacterized protein n=1 Tax=Caenorhabditis remanei TaxID=31234 RepID=E3LCZ2_CAERE|nr:hypothetical protein CRE_00937 [Caenorhabditis remanei]